MADRLCLRLAWARSGHRAAAARGRRAPRLDHRQLPQLVEPDADAGKLRDHERALGRHPRALLDRRPAGLCARLFGAGPLRRQSRPDGGRPLGQSPTKQHDIPFFFTVGDADFAYYELLDLQGKLLAAGLPHRLEIFAGSHQWPPEELFTRAVNWMEMQDMKRGQRGKDAAFVEELWSADLARARTLEAGGQLVAAQTLYAALARDFGGLRDTADAVKAAARLKASEAFQREREVRLARDQRDREYLERVPRLFKEAPGQPTPDHVSQLIADLKIPELKKRAKSDPDPEERLSAERVLYAVYIQTGLYLPREYSSLGQFDRAILFLQVAEEIDPDVPNIPYRLATAYARKGNRRRALDYLETSVRKGWTDLDTLESERAFDPFRKSEQFRRIVNQIRQRQTEAPRTP